MSGMHVAQRRLIVDAVRGTLLGSFADFESSLDAETERRRGLLRTAPGPAVVEAEELPTLHGIAAGRLEEAGWEEWLRAFFPNRFSRPFSTYQREFWEWSWGIESDVRPRPFIGIWPRGGGKSESGENCVAAIGARRRRRYGAYICETQPQADKRVGNVSRLLESRLFAAYYPDVAARAVSKYGSSRGWRRNRLVTRSGFVVDAMGLDSAARGLKEDDARPDFLIFDDVDNRHDSDAATRKKLEIITDTILPMATEDAVFIGLQNLIIPDGIFSRLADGRAEFLIDRIVSGPIPAIYDLKTERVECDDGVVRNVITSGVPSWEGQDLAACQAKINTFTLASFLREQQQEVSAPVGALWRSEDIQHLANVPSSFRRIVVGVDPTGGRAEAGVVAVGVVGSGESERYYVLDDVTQPGHKGPRAWAAAAGEVYRRRQANAIAAEKNYGGDMVKSTLRDHAGSAVHVVVTTSSRGKDIRADPVVADYQAGKVYHCGTFPELEREMTRWVPGRGDSPNRVDALVFAMNELREPSKQAMSWTAPRPPGY